MKISGKNFADKQTRFYPFNLYSEGKYIIKKTEIRRRGTAEVWREKCIIATTIRNRRAATLSQFGSIANPHCIPVAILH